MIAARLVGGTPGLIRAVDLEHSLRQIEPDHGNFAHRPLPKWITANPPWHTDAAGGGVYSIKAPTERRDLLEILEDRHGRGSTIVTSQLPVDHWHEAIGDPTLADAILDRLVHNAQQTVRGTVLPTKASPVKCW